MIRAGKPVRENGLLELGTVSACIVGGYGPRIRTAEPDNKRSLLEVDFNERF